MSNIREYTIANLEEKVAINMDKVSAVNIDATGRTRNAVISFSGIEGDYLEVAESYDQVVKEWKQND